MVVRARAALRSAEGATAPGFGELVRRILIPMPAGRDRPPGLVQALTVDPWTEAGKYGLGWTYFALAMVGLALFMRLWHYWQDKIRQAIYKQEVEEHFRTLYRTYPEADRTAALATAVGQSSRVGPFFFPDKATEDRQFKPRAHLASVDLFNDTLALFRWVFYRPVPDIRWNRHTFTFSSLAVLICVFTALTFVTLYCFLEQPLYWQSIRYGSPPVAIRAGMLAVAMTPWIIATSTKTNILTLVTDIGPERLNVFHRWLGYLSLFLSLIHTIPFFLQPVWEDGGMQAFGSLFPPGSGIMYGSGIACLVPLAWLCIASLPVIRRKVYELFVLLHVPVGLLYVGLLFWHTNQFLLSWGYLWATVVILTVTYAARCYKLNWIRPWRRPSWLKGDEAAIRIMPENAIKMTIPTQMRWKPGQYVYLRMPAISLLENHPFTITSLCSEDFPSEYGEQYRDCVLVFRPFGGFTKRVLETAVEKGPFHTYRVLLDGPYGGIRRDLAAFDTCILIAGGSGITSLMSQLLHLIKRMRDGKAITKTIVVVWSLKRLEAMDWFREELRICRESAPPESVTCKFFVTATKPTDGRLRQAVTEQNADQVSHHPIAFRPQPPPRRPCTRSPEPVHLRSDVARVLSRTAVDSPSDFDLSFMRTPRASENFAFPPSRPVEGDGGWSVNQGRPDLGHMLRNWATGGSDGRGILGRRTAVFVCGPPAMRVGVAKAVAQLQAAIWGDETLEEIFLHAENYAL